MNDKIFTSNFSISGEKENSISIARGTPSWFNGEQYPKLFPSWDIIMGHKNGEITDEEYTKIYYNEVLDKLDPVEVYNDLKGKILLCWCAKRKFCHRRIAAEWLEKKMNIKVKEI